jgi:hypothetical protein
VSRLNIFGWVVMTAGLGVWAYGYFTPGHAPLVDWARLTPHWISEFIPNLESEIGLAAMILAMVPAYWPKAAA